MRIQLAVTALLSTIALSGCAMNHVQPIYTQPVDKPPLVVPGPDQVNMRDVKWIVVTKDNVNKVFDDLQKQGGNLVLFAVTDKGYENLSLNLADLLKLTRQQKTIIGAYQKYYEPTKVTNGKKAKKTS